MMLHMVKADPHLLLLNNSNGKEILFVVPGAGGRCEAYHELARALEQRYTVYGLLMMGTEAGELPLNTIEEIARQNIAWIKEIQPVGPYRIIGHSFGGHVAYEMTRLLKEHGDQTEFLAILDVWAGLQAGILPDADEVDFALQFTADYFRDFNIISTPYPAWVEELREALYQRPLKEMAPYIANFVSAMLPEKAENIDFVSRLVNLRIYNSGMVYKPVGKIDVPVLVFRKYVRSWWPFVNKTLDWHNYARNIRGIVLPGNHDMTDNENSLIVARHLLSMPLPQST